MEMNSQDYQENDFEKEFFISGDNHNSKKLKRVLKSEQYDFFREKIEKEFVRINNMLMKNQTVFVSELPKLDLLVCFYMYLFLKAEILQMP